MTTTSEERRATGKDWAKAITCSIILLLLLLFLFWPDRSTGRGGGDGEGFGDGGSGPGGLGNGTGIGAGAGSGTGDTGNNRGSESAGTAGGGESNKDTMGGDAEADSTTTFGRNTEATEGKNRNEVDSDSDALKSANTSSNGSKSVDKTDAEVSDSLSDTVVKSPGTNTLAIIEPNAAPSAKTETANRYIGGQGRSGASGGSEQGRNIGGMNVKGGSLGVILDVSGSMRPYLEDLRREIRKSFSKAVFLEVNGCSLYHSSFDAETFLNAEPPKNNQRYSVMDAMHELAQVYQVDAVYWFCDLQDSRQLDALSQLRNLVWDKEMPALSRQKGGTSKKSGYSGLDEFEKLQEEKVARPNSKAKFRLYIRSTGDSPDSPLKQIIDESGGQFQKKR